ncbi:vomeronasal type-2 receptor 26-like [Pelodytes ibericus]
MYSVVFAVVVLLMLPHAVGSLDKSICVLEFPFLDHYYQDGDLIIGGILTVRTSMMVIRSNFQKKPHGMNTTCRIINMRNYENLLAFVFAITEINNDKDLLPNISLGFHVFDSCYSEERALMGMINLLSGNSVPIPNYYHGSIPGLVGFVDGISSKVSLLLARLFGLFKIPQISYSSQDPVLSDKIQFPTFYRTVPNDVVQFQAIVKLIQSFAWSWVGILVSDNESGLLASQILQGELPKNDVCAAFLEFIPYHGALSENKAIQIVNVLNSPSANVVVVYGDRDYMLTLQLILYRFSVPQKVWIIFSQWDVSSGLDYSFLSFQPFNGSLALTLHSIDIPGFEDFVLSVNPDRYPNDIFILNVWLLLSYVVPIDFCLLNMMGSQQIYLKHTHFTNVAGADIHFDENGDMMSSKYDIFNWVMDINETLYHIKVGRFDQQDSSEDLVINKHLIRWSTSFKQIPQSMCSETCLPGYRKSHRKQQPSCCYDCIPCPEGEISNQTDMETCDQCPDDKWPNPNKDMCIFKTLIYLSYEEPMGESLAVVSVLLFFLTNLVMVVVTKHKDTPIVRANNRNLSYLLLTSLMVCFLCSLIFIGQPSKVSCILQQAVFGVTFSISISSILAKTVTVVVAFNATKPGSKLKNWVGSMMSYVIVVFCTLVQVCVCVVWLATAPPFPYYNMHYEAGTIVAECNEGSVTGFYSVLGYMGFLSILSFIIAFLARNLPDVFNEAKFITFSMLVFCSVWISFIPAYLSTKGKYVVAVEIFAIQASGAGLLGCIFIPKCYIILFRPHKNSKVFLTRHILYSDSRIQ